MAELAQKYQDELGRIKKNVQAAYEYFLPNIKRWQEFQEFVFETSLSDTDREILSMLKKPQIEFNILNAFVSRLRGEFAKQEPSIEVSADFGADIRPQLIDAVEGIFRHMESQAREDGTSYRVYTDQLAGGFSWFKVWTEYANSMSMKQVIRFGRVDDPTLCFCDPMAKKMHKSDARYWGELYPMTKEQFKAEFNNVDADDLNYIKSFSGFSWSYSTEKEDILLVCDYYEKKPKRVKIVLLANNEEMKYDEYKEGLIKWEESGVIEQPPAIIKSRWTIIDTICRYRVIENKVLEYVETDFVQPNYIFVDGDSVFLRKNSTGELQQKCRPYVYHAKGLQQLKNFAGQTIANNLENQMQSKLKACKEGIPPEHEDTYTNIQQAGVVVYNAFKDDDPNIPLPPPQEIAMTPSPPENMQIFGASDQTVQMILGSYDASLGINNNQLSGAAIDSGAIQSNAAAMPYVVNYMLSLNQVAQVILSLIPKVYTLPNTLPIIDKQGEQAMIQVNQPGGVKLDFGQNDLNIKVKAGVNFSIQKSKALKEMIGLMQASPIFAQFMNTFGLSALLDNVEFRGSDQLREQAQKFMMMLQQKQQQQSANPQPNPLEMKNKVDMARMAQKDREMESNTRLKAAEISIDAQKEENERLRILSNIENSKRNELVQMDKNQTEKAKLAVDMAMDAIKTTHKHGLDHKEHRRKVVDTLLKHHGKMQNEATEPPEIPIVNVDEFE